VAGLPTLHAGEDLGHRRLRLELHARPERAQGGLVREGSLGPQVGNLQARLERDGAGDDLPKHRLQAARREVAHAKGCHAVQDGALPGGRVGFEAVVAFDLPDPARQSRPPVEQAHDLLVHRVYPGAERAHLVSGLVQCVGGKHMCAAFR
jgi:hypothetical protein